MACSNTFGLVTGAFLLGFGLIEIPRSIWRNANWNYRQKILSHRVAKMALKLDDAHQELSNAIVIAQATSNQMSKRDPLRPYMDVIDNMLLQMRMGNIDTAVPFFGEGFNKIYPLFMVIYTILIASNFFDRVIDTFGSWYKFRFEKEAEDADGFDPSGLIILKKERSWLEQGHMVGEHVVPLARNFNNLSEDIEADNITKKPDLSIGDVRDKMGLEMKVATASIRTSKEDGKGSQSKILKEDYQIYGSKGGIANKYAALREHQNKPSNSPTGLIQPHRSTDTRSPVQDNKVNVSNNRDQMDITSGFATKWESMKSRVIYSRR